MRQRIFQVLFTQYLHDGTRIGSILQPTEYSDREAADIAAWLLSAREDIVNPRFINRARSVYTKTITLK